MHVDSPFLFQIYGHHGKPRLKCAITALPREHKHFVFKQQYLQEYFLKLSFHNI